jgi:hypothetical protein
MINNKYFEICNCRLNIKLTYIREAIDRLASKYNFTPDDLRDVKDRLIDKEEEILAFGELLRIEYEKNKLCKELTRNNLFELKTIRDFNSSIDKVIKSN